MGCEAASGCPARAVWSAVFIGCFDYNERQIGVGCVNFPAVDSRKPGRKRIAVIPGDGIGKEVIPQAVKVIEATGAAVELSDFDWGADRYLRDHVTVPPDGFTMLGRDFDAILVGAFGDP